jgi:DNA modification methylase
MSIHIHRGDCRFVLRAMPDESVHCCVTSPPYFGLRDYGIAEQIGLEATPEAFVAELVKVFREVRRVLRDDGTLWLNLGDSYANDTKWGGSTSGKHVTAQHGDSGIGRRRHQTGLKSKDLIGIPWRVAFALQADGWYLRQDIIWSKPNPMPESVQDRCTKAHEYLFLLSKSPTYFCDMAAIAEPAIHAGHVVTLGDKSLSRGQAAGSNVAASGNGLADSVTVADTRNKRSVWTVATQPFKEAHFATFPPDLIVDCIKAGCPVGGTVLDPFGGAGTTGLVADRLQRNATLIELNPTYASMAEARIRGDAPLFAEVA